MEGTQLELELDWHCQLMSTKVAQWGYQGAIGQAWH